MKSYKTPNVYVEEIATFAPSVVSAATAVPAFVGYTKIAGNKMANGYEYNNKPVRITNMLEYENIFGKAYLPNDLFTFEMNKPKGYRVTTKPATLKFSLYYQLQMYFTNGGGVCYVVSVGQYEDSQVISVDLSKIQSSLNELKKEDEPTLIVFTDAIMLDAPDYYTVCQQALQQCQDLQDRFVILDIPMPVELDAQAQNSAIEDFRSNIGQNNLKYGAAYYPYLRTSLPYLYNEAQVTNALKVNIKHVVSGSSNGIEFKIEDRLLTITIAAQSTAQNIVTAWENWILAHDSQGFDITGNDNQTVINVTDRPIELTSTQVAGEKSVNIQNILDITYSSLILPLTTLEILKTLDSKLYSEIKEELDKIRLTLAPSGAIAGIYASVDRDRGIWKAPANVSINAVIEPIIKITDAEQNNLNVHDTGKSINVIRSFTGKGTLVWGSRTLAGNDNEWRYIPVRRLFSMIEKSIKRSTSFAVFEPNTEMTWLKVRVMIENYLNELWSQGGLAGSKAEDAYFVQVGLGKTMTAQDILEGRMITKIGLAAVRPAEFVIMQFSHLLQKS